MVEIELTVVQGPSLTWNGGPVRVPEPLRPWLEAQTVGTVLRGSCRYGTSGLELERAGELVSSTSAGDDAGLQVLGERGLLEELLRATAGRTDATALCLRARALVEQRQLKAGFELLGEALRLGGPDCELDAWHSPWVLWLERPLGEKLSLISRPLVTPLFRWAALACNRTRPEGLDSMLDPALRPFFLAQRERPSGPWHAGGPRPIAFDWARFARAALGVLRPRLSEPSLAREALLADAVLQGQPVTGLEGEVTDAARRAVHELSREAREGEGSLASVAAGLALAPWAQGTFSGLTQALDLAELAALVPEDRRPRVQRVIFRGFVSLRAPPLIVVAQLDDGHLLTVVRRKSLVFTEGRAEDALAAVPEIHFELALDALRAAQVLGPDALRKSR